MADGPAAPPDPTALTGWFRTRSTRLSTVRPDAPLDDLEPLRGIVGDARVVAIGEGAHFVAEFGVERALIDAGHRGATVLADLRGAPSIASIRVQGADLATPVAEAFDAVVATPSATLDPTVSIPTSG